MITSALIKLGYSLGFLIISVFPFSAGFSTAFTDAFDSLNSYIMALDVIFPVSDLLICLTIVLGTQLIIFGFGFLRWIVSHVPFIGGKGN